MLGVAICVSLMSLVFAILCGTKDIRESLQELNQTGRRVADALDRLELMEILETEPEEVQSGG